ALLTSSWGGHERASRNDVAPDRGYSENPAASRASCSVRVEERGGARRILRSPCLDVLADHLQVLLRHRPPSISASSSGGLDHDAAPPAVRWLAVPLSSGALGRPAGGPPILAVHDRSTRARDRDLLRRLDGQLRGPPADLHDVHLDLIAEQKRFSGSLSQYEHLSASGDESCRGPDSSRPPVNSHGGLRSIRH